MSARRVTNLRPVQVIDKTDQVPPHDMHSEQVVLAEMIDINSPHQRIGQIREFLEPKCFFPQSHQRLCEAIFAIDDAGVRPDVPLVVAWLQERKWIDSDLSIQYIKDLARYTEAAFNIDAHVAVVLRYAKTRAMLAALLLAKYEAYVDVGDRDAWFADVANRIRTVADLYTRTDAVGAKQSAGEALRKSALQGERRGRLAGVDTGLAGLNIVTGGLQPGDLTVLTAKSGGGKTALAVCMAIAAAKMPDEDGQCRNGVLFFSLEMPHEQLGARLVGAMGRVDLRALRDGRLTDYDQRRALQTYQDLGELPLITEDQRDISMSAIRARTQRYAERFANGGLRLALVVVDYLQLINNEEFAEAGGRSDVPFTKVAKALVHMAEAFSVPVVALAQLNSDGEIRESRAILHYAHNWFDIEREEDAMAPKDKRGTKAERDPEGPEEVSIKIRKQRHGSAGIEVKAWFYGKHTLFTDVGER